MKLFTSLLIVFSLSCGTLFSVDSKIIEETVFKTSKGIGRKTAAQIPDFSKNKEVFRIAKETQFAKKYYPPWNKLLLRNAQALQKKKKPKD